MGLEALKSLDQAMETRFSRHGDLERLWFSYPLGRTMGSLSAFVASLESEIWPHLSRMIGIGPDDTFDLRTEPIGLAGQVWGYRVVYPQDRDKFIFMGRRDRPYFVYTMAGPGSSADTNTILEVRSGGDQLVAMNDDCSDREMPPNGTRYSCLRFTPSSTAPYRLVVRRGPNGAYGSRARYRLVVESRGDDYPGLQQDASPVPPGTSVAARISFAGDADWFYQTLLSGDSSIALLIGPDSGESAVHVRVEDHTGRLLVNEWVSEFRYFVFSGQPMGVYYLRVWSNAPSRYFVWWNNDSSPGHDQAGAFVLGGGDVPTPLPSIGLTSRLEEVGERHYYLKSAARGEICILDAHATVGAMEIWVERDKRPATPEWEKIMAQSGDDAWQTLVEDEHGGMVAEGRYRSNAHVSFVAPWGGDYFVVVEAAQAPASYTLWVGCGLVWTNYPEFP